MNNVQERQNALLIVPGQAARDLSTLGTLVLTSVAAQPNGSGGPSSTLTLSGQVTNPGTYNSAQLAALTPQTTVDLGGGTTYTGPPLASFLNATGNITSTIVDAVGTDGYTVAFALAEGDPAVGGNANDILAWATNDEPLTTNAVARLIFPNDNQRGRWNSNLDLLQVSDVTDVPEPASAGILAAALGLLGLIRRSTLERKRPTAASHHTSASSCVMAAPPRSARSHSLARLQKKAP
jgi:PEP-CTERM motif